MPPEITLSSSPSPGIAAPLRVDTRGVRPGIDVSQTHKKHVERLSAVRQGAIDHCDDVQLVDDEHAQQGEQPGGCPQPVAQREADQAVVGHTMAEQVGRAEQRPAAPQLRSGGRDEMGESVAGEQTPHGPPESDRSSEDTDEHSPRDWTQMLWEVQRRL